MKFPSIKDLSALIRDIKRLIRDDYADEPGGIPCITLTVGVKRGSPWTYQTGDNSYSGGAYGCPVWGVRDITRRCDSRAVAREILDELREGWASCYPAPNASDLTHAA